MRSAFADNGHKPVWQAHYAYDLATRTKSRDNTHEVYEYTDEDWRFGHD